MNRQLSIQGLGKTSIAPDQIELSLQFSTKEMQYQDALKENNLKIDTLQEILERLSFEKESLKTTHFSISTQYKNVQDKDNNYQSVFDGYLCQQHFSLELELDLDRLSLILDEIAKHHLTPRISLDFSLRDKQGFVEEVITKASADAFRKAELLATSAHVKLGSLISIDYHSSDIDLYSPTRPQFLEDHQPRMMKSAMNITPQDIVLEQQVTIIWEIL